MARRQILPSLALFLALIVLASGSLQAAQAPRAHRGLAGFAGFGVADLWSALQWLVGNPVQGSRPTASQRADLPKEGPAVDPNGTPKPTLPPPLPNTSSWQPGEMIWPIGDKH